MIPARAYALCLLVAVTACHDAPATLTDASLLDAPANVTDAPGTATDAPATDTLAIADASLPDASAPDASLPQDPLSWSPLEPGPFHVGYRTFPHTYTPRGATSTRTVQLHVWYPTLATTGPHPTYLHLFPDPVALTDAPLAPSVYPAGYPVHAYSHGDRGFGGTSHFLMGYFASHGWVSIAPDHTGNTLTDNIDPRPAAIVHLRPEDMTAALDALEHLDPADPLAGHTVTSHVLFTGHSFGSETMWASAGGTFDVAAITAHCPDSNCTANDLAVFAQGAYDPRIVAAVPMAGSIDRNYFGANGHASVRVPMFAMSGTDNPVGDEAQFANTAGVDLTWIEVAGGCHQFFALGGCANIDDSFQPRIVGTYALAVGRRYVLEDTDARIAGILDGTFAVSQKVTYHHHAR